MVNPKMIMDVEKNQFCNSAQENRKKKTKVSVKKDKTWLDRHFKRQLLWQCQMTEKQWTHKNLCKGCMNNFWKFQHLKVKPLFKITKKSQGVVSTLPPSPHCTPKGYGRTFHKLPTLFYGGTSQNPTSKNCLILQLLTFANQLQRQAGHTNQVK